MRVYTAALMIDKLRRAFCAVFSLCLMLSALCRPVAGQDPGWFLHNGWSLHDRVNCENKKVHCDRYEGLLSEPNAMREYEMLGFFALASGQTTRRLSTTLSTFLHVAYYVPEVEPAFLQAKQAGAGKNYLMVPKEQEEPVGVGWKYFQWPTDAVIDINEIEVNELGAFVRLKSDNEFAEDLAPVLLYTGSAEQHPPDTTIANYEMIFRINERSVTDLQYDIVSKTRTQHCYYNALQPCGSKTVKKNVIVEKTPIQLAFSLTKNDVGPVSIHIEGQYKNLDDKLVATYRFFHNPDCCR